MTDVLRVCPVCKRYRPVTATKGLMRPHPKEVGQPGICLGSGQMPKEER